MDYMLLPILPLLKLLEPAAAVSNIGLVAGRCSASSDTAIAAWYS